MLAVAHGLEPDLLCLTQQVLLPARHLAAVGRLDVGGYPVNVPPRSVRSSSLATRALWRGRCDSERHATRMAGNLRHLISTPTYLR